MKFIDLNKKIIFAGAIALIFASCFKTQDAEAIRLYALAYDEYSAGKFLKTAEILKNQNRFFPSVILRAKAEYFSGDLENAEKSGKRAVNLRPSSLEARLYLARIFREKGDSVKAADLTENMLADNPQDIRVLRFAAELASDAGRYGEASIFLDRAAEYSAESAMVFLDRARLRWIAGRGEDALEDLNTAKALLPWDTPLLKSILNLEKIIKEALL